MALIQLIWIFLFFIEQIEERTKQTSSEVTAKEQKITDKKALKYTTKQIEAVTKGIAADHKRIQKLPTPPGIITIITCRSIHNRFTRIN